MGLFDLADVPAGPGAYAEAFDPTTFLKMPFNAAVNVGYLVVGAYWLYRAFRPPLSGRSDVFYFRVFSVLAVLYGPVQFVRIVTQERAAGILDQWITLPFFALVVGWSLEHGGRASSAIRAPLLGVSLGSYFLAAVHPRGFEAALLLHIAAALVASWPVLRRGGRGAVAPYALALVSCALFVGLKEADFALAELGLTRLTGHFWSKVADFAQIHFVAMLFSRVEPEVARGVVSARVAAGATR